MNYETVQDAALIEKAITNLSAHNFKPQIVNTKEEALELIKNMIPAGASVMNGSSVTLNEIGFIDYLKSGNHGWNNIHEAIVNETDPNIQATLRQQALTSEYYLGSVHALSATGELVIASNSGSQLPHLVFTSPNIILIVGANKITESLDGAMKRLQEYVVPKENARAQIAYGGPTYLAKTLIMHGENQALGRNVHIIIVNEALGY
ncbi:MAG TPA: lactate utilization protein [Candidatus Paceibacterota bacterium]|nr:lactate utilization protein [Candidatus Paceibacterota bacterium]